MKYCPHCFQKNEDGLSRCRHCGEALHIQNEVSQLPPMTNLNRRYLVGKVLGAGGFGITYAGYDLLLKKRVAIKEYYPNGLCNRISSYSQQIELSNTNDAYIMARGKEKFLEEAQIMSCFSQLPTVVDVRDFFEANGTAYIVMEYLDGVSLGKYLKQHGPERDFNRLYAMLRPVMADLARIHQEKLIHRDISPSNLMLLKDGSVKLLDFGTAREMSEEGGRDLTVMLKHGYAPPEQYSQKGRQGAWTDIYALCATIYKLLTDIRPDAATDRQNADTLKPPSQLGVTISRTQEQTLLRGLALKRTERTQSLTELMAGFDGSSEEAGTKKLEAPTSPAVPPVIQTETNGDRKKPKAAKSSVVPPVVKTEEEKSPAGKLRAILIGLAAVAVLVIAAFLLRTPKPDVIIDTEQKNEEAAVTAVLPEVKEAEPENTKAPDGDVVLNVKAVETLLNPEDGTEADYAAVLDLVKRPAEEGDANAMYYMGLLSAEGWGVKQDYATARVWYEKLAELGDAAAISNLGWLYQNGYGVEQDYAAARVWYEKAAELGDAAAMSNLGWLHQNGYGVKQDYAAARAWYEKAADLGNAIAMANLGWLYRNGYGAEQNDAKAWAWYKKAAELGNVNAMDWLGWLYYYGHGVEQSDAKAWEWYKKAAELGDAAAMNSLGVLYEYGYGVQKDPTMAQQWYNKARAAGYPD